ncbi:MAG: hypothetical protein J6386_11540 [Candidatus Synoicihabitans palmerolidicus]|nr:hypothetical protein [Candidatus Synoicihabitans palmerolidicus]
MVDTENSVGIALESAEIGRLFPFLIEVDVAGSVQQLGRSLSRVCPDIKLDTPIDYSFEPSRPHTPFHVKTLRDTPTTLSLIRERSTDLSLLRGQWVSLPSGGVVFLGSPWLSDTTDLRKRNLSIEDVAIHDPAVDLLQILRSQNMATDGSPPPHSQTHCPTRSIQGNQRAPHHPGSRIPQTRAHC